MRSCWPKPALTVALAVALGAPAARPAAAGSRLFMHSINTVAATPLELAVSPYVAGDTLVHNMDVQGMSTGAKRVFAVPGFIWLWMSQIGMGAGRGMGGFLQLPVGLALLATPWDLGPLLDMDREPALYKRETARGVFMFGVYIAKR
jgi:hypothetical protein